MNGLRRTATVAVAAAGIATTVAIPTASAFEDTYCGENTSIDGVYARACFYWDPFLGAYRSAAKLRMPSPLDPAKWTHCQVNVAIFRKTASATEWSRMQTYRTAEDEAGTCLSAFRENSQNNTAFRFHDVLNRPLYPEPRTCYRVMVRWYGTYDGQPVGMSAYGPFAYSVTICGNATGVTVVDDTEIATVEQPETPTGIGVRDDNGVI
jgi:hypothetical protein